jgi:hypothetical protein
MKSPFPGMDPYLEARWSDVHATLIAFSGESLQPALPSGLRARCEERFVFEDDGAEISSAWRRQAEAQDEGAVVADLIAVDMDDVPVIDRFLRIIDSTNGNRVVTAIEALSPWNKLPGKLNQAYCRKVADYGSAGVSVVQIDLLRSSRVWLPWTERVLKEKQDYPYYVSFRRAWQPERWWVYAIDGQTGEIETSAAD